MDNDTITIMVVRQGGKIRSIKLRINRLFYLGGAFLAVLIGFSFVIYGYQSMYVDNPLAHEVKPQPPPAVASEPHNTSPSKASPNETSGIATPTTSTRRDTLSVKPPPVISDASYSVVDVPNTEYQSAPVSISHFDAEPLDTLNGGVRMTFRVNNMKQEKLLQGYVFVVGYQRSSRKNGGTVFPRGHLTKEGIPDNYRLGESFTIRRFKPITCEFLFADKFTAINEVNIFVFAYHGALLLKKQYGLMDVSMAR